MKGGEEGIMPKRSRQKLKSKRIRIFTIANQERALTEIRTKHGIATIHIGFPWEWDKSGFTLFSFVYEEESHLLRYDYPIDPKTARKIAIKWIKEITNVGDVDRSDEWLENFLGMPPEIIKARFKAFLPYEEQ